MTLYMCLGQTLNCESKGRYLIPVNEPKAGIYSDGQDLFVPLTGSGSYVLEVFIYDEPHSLSVYYQCVPASLCLQIENTLQPQD